MQPSRSHTSPSSHTPYGSYQRESWEGKPEQSHRATRPRDPHNTSDYDYMTGCGQYTYPGSVSPETVEPKILVPGNSGMQAGPLVLTRSREVFGDVHHFDRPDALDMPCRGLEDHRYRRPYHGPPTSPPRRRSGSLSPSQKASRRLPDPEMTYCFAPPPHGYLSTHGRRNQSRHSRSHARNHTRLNPAPTAPSNEPLDNRRHDRHYGERISVSARSVSPYLAHIPVDSGARPRYPRAESQGRVQGTQYGIYRP